MKTRQRARLLLTILMSVASLAISTVRLRAQPTIAAQPTNQSVLLGGAGSFSVAATGTGSLSYVWQFEGTNTTNTGPSLSIPVVHHADVGSYDVIVTDQTGSVTSSVVKLTPAGPRPIITLVTNTPDYNVIDLQYTVAPNGQFQLFVAHDLTPPIQWFGPAYIRQSGGASNYNWSYARGTNYTEYYPKTFWRLDPYP
ncbi:MAG: immunoglobulin domain-containing protein [Verrucomicrobiota bacterium]|jgi:hypothetical protein